MIAGNTTLDRFVLEAIDPGTECVVTEAKLQTADASEILDLLTPDARALVLSGAACDLERDEVERVQARFDLAFEPGVLPVRLRPACRLDDLPYLVHTGRELALMLAGRKPLAVFSGAHPSIPDREEIPERLFDPHVVAGKFIKRERISGGHPAAESAGKTMPATRTVLYALPQHAWRIDAYFLLRDTAARAGWSEGFERMEGSLLGYEDWQNDIFIEQIYRAAVRSRRTS
jgi:hypothetical protein